MPLQLESKMVGDVCVLVPEGKIVIGDEVGAMREKIKEVLQNGHKNILLSLEKVSYMDSTGVGALVGSFTTIRNQGGQLKLSSLSQRTRDILLVTKLLTVFDTYQTTEEAIASFSK